MPRIMGRAYTKMYVSDKRDGTARKALEKHL